jgi:hypothetical protein
MAFKIFYSSDFYRIEADKEQNILVSKWLRAVTHDELITGGTKLYEALLETRIERTCANAQALGALNATSKDWMANEFYELLSLTNLKKLARIMPSSVFHQLALESVMTRAEAMGKARFEVRNFSDPDEAMAWLLA